jgi:hypothetical protein
MDSWDGAIDNEANAALITSAPELLEALEYFVFVINTPVTIRNSAAHNRKSALRKARTAITKAKGGEA